MTTLVESGTQRRYEIAGARVAIGRSPDNDMVLEDRMVSLKHAELVRGADGSLRIRDLGSRHGTYVGSERVVDAPVHDGDELLIGPVRFRVEQSPGTAQEKASSSDELRKLRAVIELSRAIGVEHDLDRLLDRVLDTCFQLFAADRGMIVTYLPHSKTPCATLVRTREGARLHDALSTSVLSQVMATREPYIRTEIDRDSALQHSQSLALNGVRSLVAVPLLYQTAETEWLGVIHLDSRADKNLFTSRDLEVLGAIASQAALAIKNAMLVRQMQAVRSADWLRLERVVASLPVGVVVLDEARQCVLANDWVTRRANVLGAVRAGAVVEQIAGISTERLSGDHVREQVQIGSPEATLVVEAHTDSDSHESVVVITDITVEREQQTRAAHQERLALVGQLAGGIAHDFNNLLCVITSSAEFLEDEATSDEARKDLQTLTGAAKSAAALVRQLLAFSRRDAVQPVVVDIAAQLTASEKLLERAVGPEIQLALVRRVDSAPVWIDRSQLEQILMNLAVNARDAMTGKGHLAITLDATPATVTISVADTGCGMAPDVAARIFEPYFTTKGRGKGTGLGLATVHGIVQQAGGSIHVTSDVGIGTTFVITLPRTEDAPERARRKSVASASGRILLVDDDKQVRQLTERMLRRVGYDVVAVESANEALARVRTSTFDLVLTDIVMPGMSGPELARQLDRDHPRLEVVLMSAYPYSVEGRAFIAKPFDRRTLLGTLADALASVRNADA